MTSRSISVPATLSAAREALADLNGLVTAKEWERAAIVYAFTREGGQGGGLRNSAETLLTSSQFAALGIAGLRSDNTVRRYRAAWQYAISMGKATPAQPDTITMAPDLEWGEVYVSERKEAGRSDSLEIPVSSSARMEQWFATNPEQAARVAKAALANPEVAAAAFTDPVTRSNTHEALDRSYRDTHVELPPRERTGTEHSSEQIRVAQNFMVIREKLLENAQLLGGSETVHTDADYRRSVTQSVKSNRERLDAIQAIVEGGESMDAALARITAGDQA